MSDLDSLLFYNDARLKRVETMYAPAVIPIFVQTESVTVANTVTQTTLLGAGIGNLTLVANRLIVGTTIRFEAWGHVSTDASPPTLRIRMKIGTNANSDLITFAGTTTNDTWHLRGIMTCRLIGTTGELFIQSYVLTEESPELYTTATTAVILVNTEIAQTLDITAEWGAAEATATITCTNVLIELIN